MSTLAEIEAALPKLSLEELAMLERIVRAERKKGTPSRGHSVLDIPAVSVGTILAPTGDLLDEMLEGRR